MAPLGNISDHLHLVRRMSRVTGADLSEAMHEGLIDHAGWAAAITNCRGCACVGSCRDWLATQELEQHRAPAPDYCENRATFDRLARQPA